MLAGGRRAAAARTTTPARPRRYDFSLGLRALIHLRAREGGQRAARRRAGDPIGGAGGDALDDREHRVLALAAVPVVVALLRAGLRVPGRLAPKCGGLRRITTRLRAIPAAAAERGGRRLALPVHLEDRK